MTTTMDKALGDDIEAWLKTSDTLAARYFTVQDELLASTKVKWVYAKSFEVGNVPRHLFTTANDTKPADSGVTKQKKKDT